MQALQDFINKGKVKKKNNNAIILQMNYGNQRNNPLKTPARGTTFDMNTSTTLPS